jgi:hypothetical protein
MKTHDSLRADLPLHSGSAVDVDTAVAISVAVLYLVLALVLLPVGEYPRALGGGLVVFALVAAAAWRLGRGAIRGSSVLAVAFASAAVLVVPTFPAMGGRVRAAVPLGFLGMQAAMLLWASRRWTPRPPEARTPLRTAWAAGALAAALLGAVATIPILLMVFTGDADSTRVLLVYPGYFAGMLAAATAYWLLQRIAHLAVGRYLIGAVAGTCVYGAVAPVVVLLRGEPFDPAMMVAISAIAGGLLGPALALEWG